MRRFHCTLCGKCCEAGGPELTVAEALRWAERFPVALRLVSARAGRNPEAYIAHLARIGGEVTAGQGPRAGTGYAVYGTLLTVLPEGSACTALEGGLCGLHPDKPIACKAAPFAFGVPETAQVVALERWASWPCYDHPEGAAVYDGLKILDEGYRMDVAAHWQAVAADQQAVLALLARLPEPARSNLLEAASGGGMATLPAVNLVQLLLARRNMSAEEAWRFGQAQADLAERLLAPLGERAPRGPMEAALREARASWRRWLEMQEEARAAR